VLSRIISSQSSLTRFGFRARRRGRTLIAGHRGPQPQGVRVASVCNLALAWVLTLPMAMILSGLLFVIFRQIF
jgi:phosphate/sulfate permease